jgi:ribA/ribD-fused uncharacterized protein
VDDKKIIDRFTKEAGYDFLSNFYSSTISFEGQLYPSVEHAYQASKSLDVSVRETIRKAKSPADAKKLGQCITVRADWNDVKVDIMRTLIREKFENPFLRPLLLATDDADLILNNKWNDKFWGVCRGEGENWLGKILMEERGRIKEELTNDDSVP